MKKSKHTINPTKIKTILLSLAIAIVLASFVIYFIQTIYPSPDYEDYCGEMRRPIEIDKEENITQEICESNNGIWKNGYCDYYSECQEEYDTVRDKYKLVVFIVAIITGLLSISVGIILALPSVSSGLMVGGTFLTFYGAAVYWSDLSNWLRTIVLGAVLAILIWLGYKKLQS